MQRKIIIENGNVTIDVLDGVGQQCRETNNPLVSRIRQKLGLPEEAVTEQTKPEMDAITDKDTQSLMD